MKLAVMQPYLFPYIGYFQLLAAVDRLVILDDANFIKQGWINRNRILIGCRPFQFALALQHQSSFAPIYEIRLDPTRSRRRLLKTIEQAYAKAPHFNCSIKLVRRVLESSAENIGQLALESILAVVDHLEISTQIITTSRYYGNNSLRGVERVIDICHRESASEYFNLPGGKPLYQRALFAAAGIELHFVEPKPVIYRQFNCKQFVPWLSIIDVIMFNDRDTVREMLKQCEVA